MSSTVTYFHKFNKLRSLLSILAASSGLSRNKLAYVFVYSTILSINLLVKNVFKTERGQVLSCGKTLTPDMPVNVNALCFLALLSQINSSGSTFTLVVFGDDGDGEMDGELLGEIGTYCAGGCTISY